MIKFAYEHFNLLPEFPMEAFANRLAIVCRAIVDFDELSGEALDKLTTLESYLLSTGTTDIINYERSEFRGSLESHPFCTTLLLIREGENMQSKAHLELHCAMLARLFIERSHDDYDAYLAFYRALLEESTSLPFSSSFVTLASTDELQLELKKIGVYRKDQELLHLAKFIQPRKVRELKSTPHPFFTASNHHKKTFPIIDAVNTELLSATSEDGDEVAGFLKLTPKLEKLNSQEYAEFAMRVAGIERALYNAELRPAWTNLAATPNEVAEFLNRANPHLLEGDYRKVSIDAAPLLYFLLKLSGIRDPGKITLINRGSPRFKNTAPQANAIHYELKKSKIAELKDARLTLCAHLINIKGPEPAAARLHFYAQDEITFRLPEPVFSLLQNLVSETDASRRLNHSIEHAFEYNEDAYRAWFTQKLKLSGLRALNITKYSLESAFLTFSKQSVPEVTLNLLTGQSSVQHHYISQKRESIAGQIDAAWRNFMNLLGLKRKASMQLPSYPRDHDEVGSKLTIRPEILHALLKSILDNAKLEKRFDLIVQSVHVFNLLALFVFLRIATTVGLRPAKKPLPTRQDYSSALKMMSVADKRVHHRKERRMIVLPSSLGEMIDAHIRVSSALSIKLALPQPPAIVCALEDGNWKHFSPTYVEARLFALSGKNLDAHSLRHIAASRFLAHQHSHKSVCQTDVNQLLNHARANVYPLSLWSTESVVTMSARQRAQIEAYDCEFDELDVKALDALKVLEDGFSK